eukprot:1868631-Amphidinium_carterae.1
MKACCDEDDGDEGAARDLCRILHCAVHHELVFEHLPALYIPVHLAPPVVDVLRIWTPCPRPSPVMNTPQSSEASSTPTDPGNGRGSPLSSTLHFTPPESDSTSYHARPPTPMSFEG